MVFKTLTARTIMKNIISQTQSYATHTQSRHSVTHPQTILSKAAADTCWHKQGWRCVNTSTTTCSRSEELVFISAWDSRTWSITNWKTLTTIHNTQQIFRKDEMILCSANIMHTESKCWTVTHIQMIINIIQNQIM